MRRQDRFIAVSAWIAFAATPALALVAARAHTEYVRSSIRQQAAQHGAERLEWSERERDLEAGIRDLLIAEQEVRSLRTTAALRQGEIEDLRARNQALRRQVALVDTADSGRVTRARAEMIDLIDMLRERLKSQDQAEADARQDATEAAVDVAQAQQLTGRMRNASRNAVREVNRLRSRVQQLEDLSRTDGAWTRNLTTVTVGGGFWMVAAMICLATWRWETRERANAARGNAQAGRDVSAELARVTRERDEREQEVASAQNRLRERNAELQRLRALIRKLEADASTRGDTGPTARRAAGLMILGVEASATRTTATAAYRRLARTLHPDVCPGPEANRLMTLATACYEALPKTL